MKFLVIIKKLMLIILLGITTLYSYAQGVSLGKTRVIIGSDTPSEEVSITNDDNKPYLIQAGVTSIIDGSLSPNFIITPPIFRLEGKSTSAMRILLKETQSLPKDKESLFYLNTKIIPSTNKMDEETSKLVLITNFVIKVIYRPQQLNKPNDDIYRQVLLNNKNNQWQFSNPTAYYLTLSNLTFNQQKHSNSILLAPFSDTKIDSNNINKASWSFINDYGELSKAYDYKGLAK